MQMTILNKPIKETVPHIFKRPLLSVSPSDSLLHVGTFLAVGPQIYVDGLVVLDQNYKAIGTIGGRHIIEYILSHQRSSWLAASASTIMSRFNSALEADRPLVEALDIFASTEFAFLPVTTDQKVVTSLSLRDLLNVTAASNLQEPVRELSSPLIEIDYNTSIGAALEIMLEEGIRGLVVRQQAEDVNLNDNNRNASMVNDRQILEFLVSHEGIQVLDSKGLDGLFDVKINTLGLREARVINSDISASAAAKLFDVNVPFLLLKKAKSILTPWDIVIKGLKGSETNRRSNRR
jgi:predicted transcriptional regulator